VIRRLLSESLVKRLCHYFERSRRPPHRRVRKIVRALAWVEDPLRRERLRFVLALRLVYVRASRAAKAERDRESRSRQRGRKFSRRMSMAYEFKDRPCADCGINYGPEHMEFDHVEERGPKDVSVCHLAKASLDRFLAEIAKCDVVCCRCHERREVARGRSHGDARYGERRCPNANGPGGCNVAEDGVA
jgi:hypothetical protein